MRQLTVRNGEYSYLVDYPNTRKEISEHIMMTPADKEWLEENSEQLQSIDERRSELMRTPLGRAALNNSNLNDYSDDPNCWDNIIPAWNKLLDEAELCAKECAEERMRNTPE